MLLLQLAPLILVSAGAAVCIAIFLSLKKDIQALELRLKEQQREISNLEQRIAAQVGAMEIRVREVEECAGVLVPPAPPRSGFNLSKRSQAMRMSRHGEEPANIAAALNLPRKEVELLMKVQKIILSTVPNTTS